MSRALIMSGSLSLITLTLIFIRLPAIFPFTTWSLSFLIPIWIAGSKPSRLPFQRYEWLSLLTILGIASFFRLYQITLVPYGLWIDELSSAVNALNLISKESFNPFGFTPLIGYYPEWVQTHNLYLYIAALLQGFGYFELLGAKGLSVIPGIFTVIVFYLFARREVSTPRVAFLGALFLAISHWHVVLSRWGWDEVLACCLITLASHLYLVGEREESEKATVLSAFVFGIAAYTYVGARLPIAGVLFLSAIRFFLNQRDSRYVALLVTFLATITPIIAAWLVAPTTVNARVQEISIIPKLIQGEWNVFFENIRAYLLMFHYEGDPLPRHNIPGVPHLSLFTGVLFIIGIGNALWNIRDVRNQVLLLWFTACLAGGIFSVEGRVPNAYRVGIVIPAVYFFITLAIDNLRTFNKWKGASAILSILLVFFIAYEATQTYQHYFDTRAQTKRYWKSNKEGAEALSRMSLVQSALQSGKKVYVDPDILNYEFQGYMTIFNLHDTIHEFRPKRHRAIMTMAEEDKNIVLFLHPNKTGKKRYHREGLVHQKRFDRFNLFLLTKVHKR